MKEQVWALEKEDEEVGSCRRTTLGNLQRKHFLDYPHQASTNTPPFYAALAIIQIIAQVKKIADFSVWSVVLRAKEEVTDYTTKELLICGQVNWKLYKDYGTKLREETPNSFCQRNLLVWLGTLFGILL